MTTIDTTTTATATSYDDTINEIVALHRERCFYIKSDTACINQLKAYARMCMGWAEEDDPKAKDEIKKAAGELVTLAKQGKDVSDYDPRLTSVIETTFDVRGPMNAAREHIEKQTVKLVQSLPVWTEWAKDIKGVGAASVGTIIGECGSFANYANPGKVWKRMGLAPYEGRAYSTWRMKGGLNAEQWTEAGYSPKRRSWAFNLGEPIVKTPGSIYRDVYLERKAVEHEKCKAEDLIPAATTRTTVDSWAKLGLDLAKVTAIDYAKHRSAGHMEKRARRYMEKRVLRDMWRAWRDTM